MTSPLEIIFNRAVSSTNSGSLSFFKLFTYSVDISTKTVAFSKLELPTLKYCKFSKLIFSMSEFSFTLNLISVGLYFQSLFLIKPIDLTPSELIKYPGSKVF